MRFDVRLRKGEYFVAREDVAMGTDTTLVNQYDTCDDAMDAADVYQSQPEQCDVDGMCDSRSQHITFIGRATKDENGKWMCLAKIDGMLCVVEAKITFDGN